MLKLGIKIKKNLVVLVFLLLIPLAANSVRETFNAAGPTSFLPMEDALSAARTSPEFVNENIKPYRQSFNLGNQSSENGYINFTSTDILAFIFLAGVYLIFVRRNSQSRNTSF